MKPHVIQRIVTIYCRNFLTLPNQTSRYKLKCIRIEHYSHFSACQLCHFFGIKMCYLHVYSQCVPWRPLSERFRDYPLSQIANKNNKSTTNATVLPAKSDSDVMFCLQSYQGLIIDRSLVYWSYPQDRINTHVIYRFSLAQVVCSCWSFFDTYVGMCLANQASWLNHELFQD